MFLRPEGLQLYFIKNRLQHRCFPVNLVKFLKTAVFTEHLRWLLLHLISLMFSSCTLGLYNLKSSFVVYTKIFFMFIHWQFYFRNFFFTHEDFNFDWLFFIKLIWWNRTRPIFHNSIKLIWSNKNVSHFAVYIIKFIWFNKFDLINLTVY